MNSAPARNQTLYFTVATAGHVDHGKTSLLKALTGTDPDRLKEEKARGLTTDLGFAHMTLNSGDANQIVHIGFVDVPGHGKFLKNMLAGVGGIDLALLVVAANEGAMPQTEQHAKILSLLGIKHVILVMTKIDLADSEQKVTAEQSAMQSIVRHNLACTQTLFVSSVTGEGLDQIAPALLAALKNKVDRHEQMEETAYLPIDRVFSKTGYGTVITGTLVRGSLATGDNIFIEPGAMTARIRGMESFGKSVERAQAGQRLAVNLVLKQTKAMTRGQSIFLAPPTACQNLIGHFKLFDVDSIEELSKKLPGQQIRIYHGTAEVAGHVRWVEKLDVSGREELVGQISLTEPLIAEPSERFVIRFEEDGVTGGEILIGARARWMSRKKLIPLVRLLLNRDFSAAIQLYIDSSPHQLVKDESLMATLPLQERSALSAQLMEGKLVDIGGYISTQAAAQRHAAKILESLKKLEASPEAGAAIRDVEGISIEALRAVSLGSADRAVFQQLLRTLIDAGQIIKNGDKLVSLELAVQKKSSGTSEQTDDVRLLELLQKQPCLELKEIARLLGLPIARIETIMRRLSKNHDAAVVAKEFASSTSEILKAHLVLEQIWREKKDISPSDFKERLGVSRKYGMALLSYFDDNGFTRRVDNARVLLKLPQAGK